MRRRLFIALGAALVVAACATSGRGGGDRTVYHLSEGLAQATNGLRNVANHLEVDPGARIVVVAHARGVDYLMKGATDANGNKYEDLVEQLKQQGVSFEVCEITLRNRKLVRDQFIPDASFVPSGVAQIAKLQQQGFSYIKP